MAASVKELTAEIPIVFNFTGKIDKASGKIDSITEITGGKINTTDIIRNGTNPVTTKEVIAATGGLGGLPIVVVGKYPNAEFETKEIETLKAAVLAYTNAIEAAKTESERKADATSTDAVLLKDATKATVEPVITKATDTKKTVATALTAAKEKAKETVNEFDANALIAPIEKNIEDADKKLDDIVKAVGTLTGGARQRQSRKSKKAGGKKRRKSQRRKQSKQ
jgi:hypothetical protein